MNQSQGHPMSEPAPPSPLMEDIYRQAARVAAHDEPVLIVGETGVGKRFLAERIHRESERRTQPLVAFDCVGLDETILRAELFGNKGAKRNGKAGRIAVAGGGTLFLSGIDEIPLRTQGELVRVVERKEFYPQPGRGPARVACRIVVSAGLDLEDRAGDGRFRPDLYYRLSTYTLRIPPLRERREEIASLTEKFAQEAMGSVEVGVDEKVFEAFQRYSWPGNILELRNAVFQASEHADKQRLELAHLPRWVLSRS